MNKKGKKSPLSPIMQSARNRFDVPEGKMVCCICGKDFKPDERPTLEHIYPKALKTIIKSNIVDNVINSRANKALAHYACNINKSDRIYSCEYMYLTKAQRNELLSLLPMIEPAIKEYNDIKEKAFKKQKTRCYACRIKMPDSSHGSLHRKNKTLGYTPSNICLVCSECEKKPWRKILEHTAERQKEKHRKRRQTGKAKS